MTSASQPASVQCSIPIVTKKSHLNDVTTSVMKANISSNNDHYTTVDTSNGLNRMFLPIYYRDASDYSSLQDSPFLLLFCSVICLPDATAATETPMFWLHSHEKYMHNIGLIFSWKGNSAVIKLISTINSSTREYCCCFCGQ